MSRIGIGRAGIAHRSARFALILRGVGIAAVQRLVVAGVFLRISAMRLRALRLDILAIVGMRLVDSRFRLFVLLPCLLQMRLLRLLRILQPCGRRRRRLLRLRLVLIVLLILLRVSVVLIRRLARIMRLRRARIGTFQIVERIGLTDQACEFGERIALLLRRHAWVGILRIPIIPARRAVSCHVPCPIRREKITAILPACVATHHPGRLRSAHFLGGAHAQKS